MASSIKKAAARALGVSHALIPERLRNRLNGYLKKGIIPDSMIAAIPETSDSRDYTPKPIRQGNEVYLRNLVYLDTLFDDTKVVEKLILDKFTTKDRHQCLEDFKKLNIAKHKLLKSMLPMQDEVISFLEREDIDWATEEMPYPYVEYASPLIAANLVKDEELSTYDQALKCFLDRDLRGGLDLISNNPSQFTSADAALLKQMINREYAQYKEYADYLASFE